MCKQEQKKNKIYFLINYCNEEYSKNSRKNS